MKKEIIEASTSISKEVYKDVVHPSAEIVGKTLADLTKIALSPLRGFIWSWNEIEKWLSDKVTKKLENIDPTKIVTPDPLIACPIIEYMRFTDKNVFIQDMYASLLANAMNSDANRKVIPAYGEVVKQLSSLDALIFKKIVLEKIECFSVLISENQFIMYSLFKHLVLLDDYSLTEIAISLDNLCRLALIRINEEHFTDIESEKEEFFLSLPLVQQLKTSLNMKQSLAVRLKGCYVTSFGEYFGRLVIDK